MLDSIANVNEFSFPTVYSVIQQVSFVVIYLSSCLSSGNLYHFSLGSSLNSFTSIHKSQLISLTISVKNLLV